MLYSAIFLSALQGVSISPPPPLVVDEPIIETDPDYPALEMLAEFSNGCAQLADFDTATGSLTAAGWERLPEDANTPVSDLARFGADTVSEDPNVETVPGVEFRKQVAGRDVYLALSGAKVENVVSLGCRFYDFEASAPLSLVTLTEWAGRAPVSQPTGIKGGTRFAWDSGLAPTHTDMMAAFFPKDAPELSQYPVNISGLVLATALTEYVE